MGIKLFGSSFGDDFTWNCNDKSPDNTSPDPNPENFKIKQIREIGKYLWVLVNYPNCSTFKGDKILIYRNVTRNRIKLYARLDPHFSETGLSPVARFRPDSDGVELSIKFCEIC